MSLTRQWSAKVVGVHYDMCVVLYSNMGDTDRKHWPAYQLRYSIEPAFQKGQRWTT